MAIVRGLAVRTVCIAVYNLYSQYGLGKGDIRRFSITESSMSFAMIVGSLNNKL